MDQSTWRAAGIAGIAFTVINTGIAFAAGQPPHVDASGADIRSYIVDHRGVFLVGAAALAVTVPLFVWFVAALANRIRRPGDAAASLAGSVLVAAAMGSIGLLAVANVMGIGLAIVKPLAESASDDLVRYAWIAAVLFGVLSSGFAATAMLAAGVGLRHARGPAWLASSSIAAGAIVLVVSGYGLTSASAAAGAGWAYLIASLWLVATAVHLVRLQPATANQLGTAVA
jgi:hypothetical protein